jgi:hypothetical protein
MTFVQATKCARLKDRLTDSAILMKGMRALVALVPGIGAQYFLDRAVVANASGPPARMHLPGIMARDGPVAAPPSKRN